MFAAQGRDTHTRFRFFEDRDDLAVSKSCSFHVGSPDCTILENPTFEHRCFFRGDYLPNHARRDGISNLSGEKLAKVH